MSDYKFIGTNGRERIRLGADGRTTFYDSEGNVTLVMGERSAEPAQPTAEDEEFQRLEEKLKSEQDRRVEDYLARAQAESVRLVELHAAELPLMTLRKAFELGWRAGYSNALSGEK